MAFSGEERGLLGSAHYVRNPRFPLEDTVAMVNMDMVGRMTEDQLTIFGTGTATEFDSLVDKLNTKYKFDLNKDPAGRGPSDHQSFFEKKIPVFHFFTGLHNDYHRPSDDFDKINLNGMVRITDMVTELVEILVTQDTKPTFVDVRGVGNVGNRPRARAVLGVQLKTEAVDGKWGIQQVVPEGAAAGAGLKPDDIVISVAGTAIVERDDITKVLSAKRPGDKVEVKFTRDGQEQSVEVTLGRG
jgi:C-terminal processing protease CtpA/Prc